MAELDEGYRRILNQQRERLWAQVSTHTLAEPGEEADSALLRECESMVAILKLCRVQRGLQAKRKEGYKYGKEPTETRPALPEGGAGSIDHRASGRAGGA